MIQVQRFGSRCQLHCHRELLKSHIINLEISQLRAGYNMVIHYICSAEHNLLCDSAAFMKNKGVNHTTEMRLQMLGRVHWKWTNAENSPKVRRINSLLTVWMSGEMSDRLDSKCLQLFTYIIQEGERILIVSNLCCGYPVNSIDSSSFCQQTVGKCVKIPITYPTCLL